jgi:DNA-binding NtrC family response regulator
MQQTYSVDTIESLEEASAALREGGYDVVITIQRNSEPAQLHATHPVLAHARDRHLTIDELERAHILNVLANVHGHRGRAAEILGIDRRTLYRKLKEYRADGAHHKARPAQTNLS